jgi:uncharacterized Fe-S center protein
MASSVYFMDLRATVQENFFKKLDRLMHSTGIEKIVNKKDLVAVKLHFGEMGNLAYVRPVVLRQVVRTIKALGGEPFLTDANTLYVGTRSIAPSHLQTAVSNGFDYAVVGAPLIIADGLRGKSETAVKLGMKQVDQAYIGSEIVASDAIVSVAHVKGHELAGFGGAIKNMGMGCASRRGKLAQHSSLSPRVMEEQCILCGECESHCSQAAISMGATMAEIDQDTCIGCGECMVVCPNSAIEVQWSNLVPEFMEKMVEYTTGVIKGKDDKCFYLNFITNVSPGCDCWPANDAPIVRDIGVLASLDPVAIDQAAVDLINQEQALPGCCLTKNTQPGQDKFKGLYPNVDWTHQLDYAQELGLGERAYELISI